VQKQTNVYELHQTLCAQSIEDREAGRKEKTNSPM